MQIAVIKDLAQKYSAQQLEECLISEINLGSNCCTIPLSHQAREEAIDSLAKAQNIRERMEQDSMTLAEALRDLARRIRKLQALH